MFKFFYSILFIATLAFANFGLAMTKNEEDEIEAEEATMIIEQDQSAPDEDDIKGRLSKLENGLLRLIKTVSQSSQNHAMAIRRINRQLYLDSEDEENEQTSDQNFVINSQPKNQSNNKSKSILKSSDFYLGTGVVALIAYAIYRYCTYKDEENSSNNL